MKHANWFVILLSPVVPNGVKCDTAQIIHSRWDGSQQTSGIEASADCPFWMQRTKIWPRCSPCQDCGTSALDIVVETEALGSHALQYTKGLSGLEVLKLDESVGECLDHGITELLHNVQMLFP